MRKELRFVCAAALVAFFVFLAAFFVFKLFIEDTSVRARRGGPEEPNKMGEKIYDALPTFPCPPPQVDMRACLEAAAFKEFSYDVAPLLAAAQEQLKNRLSSMAEEELWALSDKEIEALQKEFSAQGEFSVLQGDGRWRSDHALAFLLNAGAKAHHMKYIEDVLREIEHRHESSVFRAELRMKHFLDDPELHVFMPRLWPVLMKACLLFDTNVYLLSPVKKNTKEVRYGGCIFRVARVF